jgi:uroporphyrinogen-III synthase
MLVAVTRPEADGERTARGVRARGHDVLLAPLMRVEPVATDLSGGWSAVAITSANALTALGDKVARLHHLPIFAVGRHSAEAADGFAEVHSADGDVGALAGLIARKHLTGSVLYLAGEDRAADLIAELRSHRVAAEMRIVYRAVTAPYPQDLTVALKAGRIDAVLHFSKRSAENYLAGGRGAGILAPALAPRQLCLSEQVAEPLRSLGASHVAVAAQPDEPSLLNLL